MFNSVNGNMCLVCLIPNTECIDYSNVNEIDTKRLTSFQRCFPLLSLEFAIYDSHWPIYMFAYQLLRLLPCSQCDDSKPDECGIFRKIVHFWLLTQNKHRNPSIGNALESLKSFLFPLYDKTRVDSFWKCKQNAAMAVARWTGRRMLRCVTFTSQRASTSTSTTVPRETTMTTALSVRFTTSQV